MKKIFSLPNLYVLLWALYYTQGAFLAQGSIWSRAILVLYLLISLYYTYITYSKYLVGRYFKALGILLLLFTIYGLVGIVNGVSFDYLKLIYLSLLPTYVFYDWTKTGKVNSQWVRAVFFVLVGVIIVQYFYTLRFIEERYTETENAVVNVAYEVLALMPLLYFWKRRPLVQYVVLAIVMAIVLSTVKRGAIIIGVLCTLYFFYSTSRESSKKMKWYIWLLIIAFVLVSVRYAVNFYENNTFAQMRIENTLEGNSSGRDFIYSRCWSIFLESGFFNLLFGHGAWATLKIMKVLAHNDWLEILVNQGVLGVFVYVYYWISIYKTYRRDKNTFTRYILGMIIIIYFISTLFSMSYSAMTLPANLALGYSLAKWNSNSSIE